MDVDLTDPHLYAHGFPHEVFAELRASRPVFRHAPVTLAGATDLPFWVLTRHADVQAANRDWETFSARQGPQLAPSDPSFADRSLTAADPPAHPRLRRLISAGFTPRMIGRLEERIRARARSLVDAVTDTGSCDVVRDLAFPLPMHVIADILGIPESDRAWVFTRTDAVLRTEESMRTDHDDPNRRELFEYAVALGQDKRAHPQDDVWTLLIAAEVPDDDGGVTQLSTVELDMFFVVLSIAGSETTRSAIAGGLRALVERPDQFEHLRAHPEAIDGAVEEILRWTSPVAMFGRTATRDVVVGGEQIRAGDRVTLWYPSANRDEAEFPDPYRFDVTRTPNRHVAFGGGGIHYCLGASLARTELRAMFGQLITRWRDIEVTGAPEWHAVGHGRAITSWIDALPVRFRAAEPQPA